jgi:cytoskeletal protein RodZ
LDDLIAFGAQLKQARENQDMSLEELERITRIRLKYLEAMERGAFGEIDSPLQLRGFLRNYARAVQLDGDAVVAYFEQALANSANQRGRRRKKNVTTPMLPAASPGISPAGYSVPTGVPRTTQPMPTYGNTSSQAGRAGWRSILRWVVVLLVAGGLTMGLIGGAIYGLNELTKSDENENAPSPLVSFATVPANETRPTLQPTPTNLLPPQSTPVFTGANQLFIELEAEQRLWVQVVTDGTEVFRGILVPGIAVLQYSANDSIAVRTSNAGGLKIRINNQDYRLGQGRVQAEQIFTLGGLIIPTTVPTDTPAATILSETGGSGQPTSQVSPLAPNFKGSSGEGGSGTASTENNNLPASPTATLFFTPVFSLTSDNQPTALPAPGETSPAPSLTPLPSPILATLTPVSSPTPLISATPTSSFTPSYTPTVPMTATPILPPRETRTPTPDK